MKRKMVHKYVRTVLVLVLAIGLVREGIARVTGTVSPSASAAIAPTAYQFGTLETQQNTAAQEAAQGVTIAELTIGWDNYEPSDGAFNSTYASQMKSALQTFQAAGMKVVLGLGLHYPPSWVFNYADSKYVDQYGGTSGQVNLVFNNVLRQKVQAMVANINSTIGLNNFYAVRITSGGDAEVLYPSENSDAAHGNEYWAYDKNAVDANSNRPSTIPVNPMSGWTPGQTTWNGSGVTTTQVTNWYNWYLGALDDVVNWQVGMYRNLGYSGQYQILTPGSGTRPSNYASGVSNYLNGAGDGNQTMGRGAAWDRIYSGISNKANVVAYVSSMADGSGNNDLCTASDASVSPTSSTINSWSATRWIAYIANSLGLQKAGENPGAGTSGYGTSMMTATSQQMQACGFQGMMWAHDNDLYAGTGGVSLSGYASTIAAANAAATATPPATATPIPPSATPTRVPSTATATSVPATATATSVPATATSTNTTTAASVPPTATTTATTVPPTAAATSTSTTNPSTVLEISSPLTLSASSVVTGQTLTGVTTLTNTGTSAVILNNIVLAGRPPNGTNAGGPFMDFGGTNAVTLNAGQSLIVQKSKTFTSSDPTGAWYSYVTYQTADGLWHDSPTNVSFTVTAPATNTPVPATATATSIPATSTATATDLPPSATATSVPATSTAAATSTATSAPPTFTPTATVPAPTTTPAATVAPSVTPSTVNGSSTLPISGAVNNAGTGSNGSAGIANLDGMGYSLSAQALQAAGVQPGGTLSAGGATFTWPTNAPGALNNVRTNDQTITPATPQTAASLVVLGTGTDGPASGSGTIFYTDGTSQPFTLTFSDWTLNGSKTATPVAGNTIAVRMSYRDNANGKRDNSATYIFTTSIPLQAGHAVQQIVLPSSTTGQIHIFGIALTSAAPATSAAYAWQTSDATRTSIYPRRKQ